MSWTTLQSQNGTEVFMHEFGHIFGAYDEYWQRIENDFTRYWDRHADVPGTYSTGWYDPFPAADSEYFAAMVEKNESPQRLIIGPWSHVGMRGDAGPATVVVPAPPPTPMQPRRVPRVPREVMHRRRPHVPMKGRVTHRPAPRVGEHELVRPATMREGAHHALEPVRDTDGPP